MSILDDFRGRYPQYKDIPDQKLADALYTKFYSDKLSRDDFDHRVLGPFPETKPQPDSAALSSQPDTEAANISPQPDIPNAQYVKPGITNFTTKLAPEEETSFEQWVKQNNVPFDPSEKTPDYDMRGFYKALQSGDPRAKSAIDPNDNRIHYPDYWKTPYHKTFSNESQFATPDAPHWNDQDQLIDKTGKVLFDDRAQQKPDMSEISKGFHSGVGGLEQILGGALGYGADVTKKVWGHLGIDTKSVDMAHDYARQLMKEGLAQQEKYQGKNPTIESVYNDPHTLDAAANWVLYNAAQGVTTTVPMLAGFLAGGLPGVAAASGMALGDIYSQQSQETEHPNIGVTTGLAIPYVLAERLGGAGARLARGILGKNAGKMAAKTLTGKVASSIGKTMGGEAAAEGTQQFLTQAGQSYEAGDLKDLLTPEKLKQYGEAAAAGAVGGAPFGIAHAFTGHETKTPEEKPAEQPAEQPITARPEAEAKAAVQKLAEEPAEAPADTMGLRPDDVAELQRLKDNGMDETRVNLARDVLLSTRAITPDADIRPAIKFVDSLGDRNGDYTPATNTIRIALNDEAMDPLDTGAHEGIHSVMEMMRQIQPDQHAAALKAFETGLPKSVSKVLAKMPSPYGGEIRNALHFYEKQGEHDPEERMAIAYAVYHNARLQNEGLKLPGEVRSYFDRITEFFSRLGNAIRGQGFQTPQDLLRRVYTGQKAAELTRGAPKANVAPRASQEDISPTLPEPSPRKSEDGHPIGSGEPPKAGLVVAGIDDEGKIHYGKKGNVHGDLIVDEKGGGRNIVETGFSGPDGRFLTRKQALAATNQNDPVRQTVYAKESEKLDAYDLRETAGKAGDLRDKIQIKYADGTTKTIAFNQNDEDELASSGIRKASHTNRGNPEERKLVPARDKSYQWGHIQYQGKPMGVILQHGYHDTKASTPKGYTGFGLKHVLPHVPEIREQTGFEGNDSYVAAQALEAGLKSPHVQDRIRSDGRLVRAWQEPHWKHPIIMAFEPDGKKLSLVSMYVKDHGQDKATEEDIRQYRNAKATQAAAGPGLTSRFRPQAKAHTGITPLGAPPEKPASSAAMPVTPGSPNARPHELASGENGSSEAKGSQTESEVKGSRTRMTLTPRQEALRKRIVQQHDTKNVRQRIADTVTNSYRFMRDQFLTEVADQFRPLMGLEKRFVEAKTGEKGRRLEAGISAYVAARNTLHSPAQMYAFLLYGPPQWDKKVGIARLFNMPKNAKAGSMKDVDLGKYASGRKVRGIVPMMNDLIHKYGDTALSDFSLYAYARRVQSQGLLGQGKEKLFKSQAEVDEALRLGDDYPELKRTFDELQDYKKASLGFLKDTGLINQDTLDWLNNQIDHVPFYRVMDDEMRGPKSKKSLSGQSAKLYKLKGSELQIPGIFENVIANLNHLVSAGMRNVAMQRTVGMASELGIAKRVPPAFKPVRIVGVDNVARQLGVNTSDLENLFEMIPPKDPNITSVKVDGKTQYWELNKDETDLISALSSFSYLPNSSPFWKFARWTKNMFTQATTGFDPGFWTRNFLRDSVGAWVQGRPNLIPGYDSMIGTLKGLRDSPSKIAIMAAGSGTSGYYHFTQGQAEKYIGKEHSRKLHTKLPVLAYETVQRVGEATEWANRIALYDRMLQQGHSEAEAAYEAADIMDFSLQGRSHLVRSLIQVVPFLNARIQGLYKLGRAAASPDTRMKFAVRGMILMGLSLALWGLNHDDQDYKDLDEYVKDTYYYLPLHKILPQAALDKFHIPAAATIPKPFEVGTIFSSIPERIMDKLIGNDRTKDTGNFILRTITGTFAIDFPQVFKPLIEEYANKNFFTGNPIVDPFTAKKPAPDQYRYNTSPTLRAIGKATDTSPLRLEHLLRGYTSTLGSYALSASDALYRQFTGTPSPPPTRIDQMPVLKSFFKEDPARSTKWDDRFYDLWNETQGIVMAINSAKKEGDMERVRELTSGRSGKLLSRKKQLGQMAKELTKLHDRMEVLWRSDKPPQEKSKDMNALLSRRNDLVRRTSQIEQQISK